MPQRGQPSERLPVQPGTKKRKGQAPIKHPEGDAQAPQADGAHRRPEGPRLPPEAGLLARAAVVRGGAPPAAGEDPVRSACAKATSGAAGGSFGHAIGSQSGRIPLRIDEPQAASAGAGRCGRRSCSTRKRSRRARSARPEGLPPKAHLPSTKQREDGRRARHADPLRLAINCRSPRCAARQLAPRSGRSTGARSSTAARTSSAPSTTRWRTWSATSSPTRSRRTSGDRSPSTASGAGASSATTSSTRTPTTASARGTSSTSTRSSSPTASAPTRRTTGGAGSDHDPIMAIFVDESEVDSGGWGGYHFFTPTEGVLLAFARAPEHAVVHRARCPSLASIPHDRGSAGYQRRARHDDRARLARVRRGGDRPLPVHELGRPAEGADLGAGRDRRHLRGQRRCTSRRTRTNTRVIKNSTALSTFWSNADNACMPQSRPSLDARLAGRRQRRSPGAAR